MKPLTQNCKQNRVVFFGLIILFLLLNWNQSFAQGPISYAPTTVPDCMKTHHLEINTGINYRAGGTPYWINQPDAYWSCIAAPGGYNVPMCAIVWDIYAPPAWAINWVSSRAISIVSSGTNASTNASAVFCNSTNPYTFVRKIWVDKPTVPMAFIGAILNINVLNTDDKLDEVRCNGTTVPGISTGCMETGGAHAFSEPIILHGGENILEFDIFNRDFSGGGSSRMALNVEGR